MKKTGKKPVLTIVNGLVRLLLVVYLLFFSNNAEGQIEDSKVNIKETIKCNGVERFYILHPPTIKKYTGLYPLVIVLHGGGGAAKGMIRLTYGKFDKLADRDTFLVVYPEGVDKHWNDGRKAEETGYTAQGNKIDDVGFISDLIDKMVKERRVDPSRVYITGMSNGAMMTYRCGCELAGKIAAIAPVAGNIPLELSKNCRPIKPLPLLAINGKEDPLMPYQGGEVTGPFGQKKIGKVLSVEESSQFWVKIDSCKSEPVISIEADKDTADGTRVEKKTYFGGKGNSEVILYIVRGGGHAWPGGKPYLGKWLIGKTSRDMDACKVIWEFFKRH